jgi:hypothetical protein
MEMFRLNAMQRSTASRTMQENQFDINHYSQYNANLRIYEYPRVEKLMVC